MDKLGLQLPMLITQIVNFAIMVFILTKLLYKPILSGLEKRKQKIADGIAAAEKSAQEEEKMQKKRDMILRQAREETKDIIEAARKEAKTVRDEIIASGKKEVEEMKKRLEKDMQAQQKELTDTVAGQTVEIATRMVRQVLGDVLAEPQQHELITKRLKQLEKVHVR